jgi:hypothetical protein
MIAIFTFKVFSPYGYDEEEDAYQESVNVIAKSKEKALEFLKFKGYFGIEFISVAYAFEAKCV